MNFNRPESLNFEQIVRVEAERTKARRQKSAERRRNRHGGFFDTETIETPKPELPDEPPPCDTADCARPARARKGGLCQACTKRERRTRGLEN